MALSRTIIDADGLRKRLNYMDGEFIAVEALAKYGLKVVGVTVDAHGCQLHIEGHAEHLETLINGNFGY